MPADRPIRLALVLSGAVALGSFEAGVICELLSAVGRGAPLAIDLIAGTSAGALVGAVAARTLVTGAPFEQGLQLWTTITLDLLTRFAPVDGQNQGLLSAGTLRDLLQRYLVDLPETRTFQPAHPVPQIGLVMTMTNIDGLADPIDPAQVHFNEEVTFILSIPDPSQPAQTPYLQAIWDRVAQVAQASAAFPGAFDPVRLPWTERVQADPLAGEHWRHDEVRTRLEQAHPGVQDKMRYADGGILDQQPLGCALNALPRLRELQAPEQIHRLLFDPDRRVLFIEPDPPQVDPLASDAKEPGAFDNLSRSLRLWSLSSSPQVAANVEITSNQRQARLLAVIADLAESMADAPGGDPTLPAWVRTRVEEGADNCAPAWLEAAIAGYYRWLEDPQLDLNALLTLPSTSPNQRRELMTLLGVMQRLRKAYLRLAEQERGEHRRAVLQQVHVDLAGRLGVVVPWVLVDWVSPPDPAAQLWGEQLVHFGGFLSARFLQHDYQIGQAWANRWLAQVVPDWVDRDAPNPPISTSVGITPLLLCRNALPFVRMGRRLVRNVVQSLGLGNRAATAWSQILFVGAGISLGAGLVWLWNAWGQMLHGSATDPLVVRQPLWIMWGMSLILLLMMALAMHVAGLATLKRLTNLLALRKRRVRGKIPAAQQDREHLPM